MLQKISRAAALTLLALVPMACDDGTDPGPAPAAVELEADPQAVFIGDTVRVTATVRDADDDIITDPDITFDSGDEDVAVVDSEGLVTGIDEGEAVITATAGGVSDAITIEVFDPEDPCFNEAQLNVPSTVQGELEVGDCDWIIGDGSLADLWVFQLDATSSVTITMTSDDLDAYLFLLDAQFTDLAQDDNSAGGTDARIQGTLPAGNYLILATTFPDETGDYTLSIQTASSAVGADPATSSLSGRADRELAPRANLPHLRR